MIDHNAYIHCGNIAWCRGMANEYIHRRKPSVYIKQFKFSGFQLHTKQKFSY